MISATYSGTTGHTGTDTSRAQAVNTRATRQVQTSVLKEIHRSGFVGRTVAELRREFPQFHHGSISSALTNMHRAGKIARLTQTRAKAKIYVSVGYEDGRETEKPTVRATATICPHCGGDVPL